VSSASSLDSQQRLLVSGTVEVAGTNLDGRSPTLISPSSLLPPPSAHSIHRSSISGGQSRPIVIRKGTQGFGFTIRSVRVYLSEVSQNIIIQLCENNQYFLRYPNIIPLNILWRLSERIRQLGRPVFAQMT
jgi:hypothetical protein